MPPKIDESVRLTLPGRRKTPRKPKPAHERTLRTLQKQGRVRVSPAQAAAIAPVLRERFPARRIVYQGNQLRFSDQPDIRRPDIITGGERRQNARVLKLDRLIDNLIYGRRSSTQIRRALDAMKLTDSEKEYVHTASQQASERTMGG